VVVLRATHKDTTEQQIVDWCRENMTVYKIPRTVQFVHAPFECSNAIRIG
jgi:fatty-acyl-CoA synthase